jgi:hypothetical protein
MTQERRKYTRYKTKDNVFAALGIGFSNVGKIQDISMGGLSFQYIEKIKTVRQKSSLIAVFHSEDVYFLPNLACNIIIDESINENVKAKYVEKKCAVGFKDITKNQKEKLEYLIKHYT